MAGHSTETALLVVTEGINIARAAFLAHIIILLDLSAAFNTVNHQILQVLRVPGIAVFLLWMFSVMGSVIHSYGFSYQSYADDIQLVLSFPQSGIEVAWIAVYLADISQRISAHNLKLNLSKTEQLIFEGRHLPSIKGPVCRIYQDVGAEMECNIGNNVFISV